MLREKKREREREHIARVVVSTILERLKPLSERDTRKRIFKFHHISDALFWVSFLSLSLSLFSLERFLDENTVYCSVALCFW
jgi:hypothetical protein